VVTLVFTDIEGSTRLLRRLHDSYALMLMEHHRILDDCFCAQGATRLSTEGDGSYFVFPSPAAAVTAALDAQDALANHDWPEGETVRVRMGIHTGEAALTSTGTYVGLAVHLAARITALGHGGQVLVSDEAFHLAELEAATEHFVDLGLQKIADFPDPVRIHQVYRGDLELFPPLKTAVESPLPATMGQLFGRADEIAELAVLAESNRLVTVLGPGGTGKTRLVIETARHMQSIGTPVHFVDLTGVSDPQLMPSYIGSALDVAQDPDVSPVRQIGSVLGSDSAVLVLDNCEHLMPDIGRLVTEVLEGHTNARVLATSRVPLGIAGERLFDLEPLAVESSSNEVPAPAVALFADRATAGASEFALDDSSLPAVRRIVNRLDGMPLAIELAASMLRLLPVDELADVLDERLDLLEGGPGRPDRHRSLGAALRWNVESLDETAERAFEALGVMTGPFSLDDLAAVAGVTPIEAIAIASSLADQSLLKRTVGARRPLFRMLETIRWFALESLQEHGNENEVRQRHMQHFRRQSRTVRRDIRTSIAPLTLDQMWPRRPNFLRALDYALEVAEFETAVDVIEGLVDAWAVRAAAREARLATTRVVEAVAGRYPALELRAVIARLEVWQAQGVGIAPERSMAERAYELAQQLGDEGAALRARIWMMGAGVIPFGDPTKIVAELEALGDDRAVAYAVDDLGWMLWWQDRQEEGAELFGWLRERSVKSGDRIATLDSTSGMLASVRTEEDIDAARAMVDEVVPLAEALGCGWWEGFHLQWEASHSRRTGRLHESAEWLERAYRIVRDRGTMNQVAFVTSNQAIVAWMLDDVETAYRKIVEFADANSQAAEDPLNPFVLEMASGVAIRWKQPEVAATLCGAAEAWRAPGGIADLGMPMPKWDEERHAAVVAEIRSELSSAAFEEAWSAGASLEPSRALHLALSLEAPAV
jgi:predicted ATPase/class 3 adenylate cyclase